MRKVFICILVPEHGSRKHQREFLGLEGIREPQNLHPGFYKFPRKIEEITRNVVKREKSRSFFDEISSEWSDNSAPFSLAVVPG